MSKVFGVSSLLVKFTQFRLKPIFRLSQVNFPLTSRAAAGPERRNQPAFLTGP